MSVTKHSLMRYDEARRALAEALRVDEVKEISQQTDFDDDDGMEACDYVRQRAANE
jgi:hypothetical protein